MWQGGGGSYPQFLTKCKTFLVGSPKQAIFSYSSVEIEKILGGQKSPIFQYSNPPPGLFFLWIGMKISMHTNNLSILIPFLYTYITITGIPVKIREKNKL